MLTPGLRCAPDTLPMNRMIASTISPGRDHGCGAADRIREGLPHHSAARGDEHEEERPEQLGEQPPPFLARVLEILERVEDVASDERLDLL